MLLEVLVVRHTDPGELNSHFSDKRVRTKLSLLGGPIDSGFAERLEESAFHNHCCNFPLFEHFHFRVDYFSITCLFKSPKVGLDDIAEAVSVFLLQDVVTLSLLTLAFSCAAPSSHSHH